MADEDDLRRNVLEPLPIERLIGAPLDAMIEAQINASRRYREFIERECLEPGEEDATQRARMISFDFPEMVVDGEGTLQEVRQRSIQIPWLAAVSHPVLAIQEGRVEFEMEITEAKKADESGEAPGHGKTAMKGVVTHRGGQTRSTDTRARYSFSTSLKREEPPEALMRVIDYLTDAATRPTLKSAERGSGGQSPESSPGNGPGDHPAERGSS